MSEWSGFFNAYKVGDIWDRTYLADDFASFFAPLIRNGVFAGRSNSLQVIPSDPLGMSVQVSSGQAWISGYSYINSDFLSLELDPADGSLNRVDAIVIQWNNTDRKISAVCKKGTPALNANPPALQNDENIKELCIAEIDVLAGLTSIKQQHIRDTRANTAVCGWVTALIEQADTSTLYVQWEAKAKDVLDAISDELADLEAGTGVELKKLLFTNISVSASSFVVDSTYTDYPYRASVALSGVLASMIPEVILGVTDAVSGNFAPVAITYNGGVYLYAASAPESAITIPTIICWKGGVSA